MAADQVGNNLFRQKIEYLGVTEEAGDIDKQVLGKKLEFAGIAAQLFPISIHVTGLNSRHCHTPFDPALQCAWLVNLEIKCGLGAKEIDQPGQPVRRRIVVA